MLRPFLHKLRRNALRHVLRRREFQAIMLSILLDRGAIMPDASPDYRAIFGEIPSETLRA